MIHATGWVVCALLMAQGCSGASNDAPAEAPPEQSHSIELDARLSPHDVEILEGTDGDERLDPAPGTPLDASTFDAKDQAALAALGDRVVALHVAGDDDSRLAFLTENRATTAALWVRSTSQLPADGRAQVADDIEALQRNGFAGSVRELRRAFPDVPAASLRVAQWRVTDLGEVAGIRFAGLEGRLSDGTASVWLRLRPCGVSGGLAATSSTLSVEYDGYER